MFTYLTSSEEVYKFMHHQEFQFFCALGSKVMSYIVSPMVPVESRISGGMGELVLGNVLEQSSPYELASAIELGPRSISYRLQV